MSIRWPAGVISKTEVIPTGDYNTSVASGIWKLNTASYWISQSLWPNANNLLLDPYFDYVTLLLNGENAANGAQNNTFLDSSTNNFTITRYGNTTQGTFSPYGSLWSNYFDGSGDFISCSPTVFGTDSLTVEAWVFADPLNAYNTIAASRPNNGSGYPGGWHFVFGADGTIGIYSDSSWKVVSSAGALTNYQWSHVAWTRSGSSNAIFVNGVRVASSTDSSNWDFPGLRIGNLQDGTNAIRGNISNLRLVKGTAVYNPASTNVTVPTSPLTAISGTTLLTCQSNRFVDNSSNNLALTVLGDTSVSRFSPFNPAAPYSTSTIGGSGYFDGTGDYLSSSSSISLTGTFTFECWVNLSVAQTDFLMLAGQSVGGSGTYISIRSTGLTIQFGTSGTTLSECAYTFPIKCWQHIAVVRSGTTVAVYINGVSKTVTQATQANAMTLQYYGVGYSTSYVFNGYISDMRVVSGTAVYTTNFTPPTAPLTAISNTQLLLGFTNAGIPDAAMQNDLETVGNAQVSTSVKKYGTGSLAFDGTGDNIPTASSPTMTLGTGSWTVEMWIYPSVGTANKGIFGTGTTTGCLELFTNGSNGFTYNFFGGSGTSNSASGTMYTGQWSHIAISRDGNTIYLALNGVVTSFSAGVGDTAPGTIFDLGQAKSDRGWYFNGYIDDLRITKGYARYTANFTPPGKLPIY